MIPSIRISVALDGSTDPETIRAALAGEAGIVLAGMVPAEAGGIAQLDQTPHDALIIACAGDREETLSFIAAAVAERPTRPVVVVDAGSANGFVGKAFDAGAADLVTVDPAGNGRLGHDINFALQKAIARAAGVTAAATASGKRATGDMIAVLGPKGGTGKTLTSCNLAAGLAAGGATVILVDLDLQFGDVGLALGLAPERTIYDLAVSGGTMDAEKVSDFLTTHESGVRALLAPRRPDHAGAVEVEFARSLFDTLREMADFVIVDTPPGFTPEVIAAIDRSSAICLVAMLDALSLKNSKLALETLDLMGYDRSRVKIVLNRADSRVGVTADDVTKLLGQAPDVFVPSHRDITRSVNEATPIVMSGGNAEARRAFQSLAGSYAAGGSTPAESAKAPRRRRRLFRRARKES
ncbi:MAG: pilus assembly protein CpaE [Solirubrobacteraceae bacterium]|jgi:pilus assembly protein CpaE|nr:pilus assembly protein CpaE [Solirubrobacteraceae bacterium]